MLYADNTILLLGDTMHSLETAMSIIAHSGEFSGLLINWDKSALMLLDTNPPQTIISSCPVPVTSLFKYLGVQVTLRLVYICHLNITPLLNHFKDKKDASVSHDGPNQFLQRVLFCVAIQCCLMTF